MENLKDAGSKDATLDELLKMAGNKQYDFFICRNGKQ